MDPKEFDNVNGKQALAMANLCKQYGMPAADYANAVEAVSSVPSKAYGDMVVMCEAQEKKDAGFKAAYARLKQQFAAALVPEQRKEPFDVQALTEQMLMSDADKNRERDCAVMKKSMADYVDNPSAYKERIMEIFAKRVALNSSSPITVLEAKMFNLLLLEDKAMCMMLVKHMLEQHPDANEVYNKAMMLYISEREVGKKTFMLENYKRVSNLGAPLLVGKAGDEANKFTLSAASVVSGGGLAEGSGGSNKTSVFRQDTHVSARFNGTMLRGGEPFLQVLTASDGTKYVDLQIVKDEFQRINQLQSTSRGPQHHNSAPSASASSPPTAANSGACYSCGGRGHIARDCATKNRRSAAGGNQSPVAQQ